jgi:ribonuclease BN (tRNA processing enzyme)
MTSPLQESGGPRIVGRVGSAYVCLVNGVFGDPLLHLRLRHQRRSLLFDLGDGARLPARIAHQVTDVFISHAHIDHISGFLWLLRSRIGEFPPCRLYGPQGLARHIEGFLQGILWDRVAELGPRFEVAELHTDRLRRFRLQAGRAECEALDEVKVKDGVVLQESGFCVRAQMLDHHTPVLAYAFEPVKKINIRKERLKARRLEPGPWLAELKQHLLAEEEGARIQLPDGSETDVATLADDLVRISPAKKLVYATDLADTPDNRLLLQDLARYAHTFFCEACFVEADADQAGRTGHLTTRACAEIAMAAEVARLVPFHLLRRYADKPQQIYDEVRAVCPRLVMPQSMRFFEVAETIGTERVPALTRPNQTLP